MDFALYRRASNRLEGGSPDPSRASSRKSPTPTQARAWCDTPG